MDDQIISEYMDALNQILNAQSEVIDSLVRQAEEQQKQIKLLEETCQRLEYLPMIRVHRLQAVDRARLDYEMECARSSDCKAILNKEKRPKKITISLTSFPRRMYELKYTLWSLTRQTLRPDRIVLWLAEEEFPRREEDLAPSLLLKMQQWNITLRWTSNERSYKKLIPALREYPEDIIVTADDDAYYAGDWLEVLYREYQAHGDIVTHRAQKMLFNEQGALAASNAWPYTEDGSVAFRNIATGVSGILYFPGCFYSDIMDAEKYLRLCPTADDLWFWAMAVLGGQKIRKTAEPLRSIIYVNPLREFSRDPAEHLMADNVFCEGNDRQLRQLIEEYPQIMEILREEDGKMC